jgi:imidazolonepropionase-like amidohydrolase
MEQTICRSGRRHESQRRTAFASFASFVSSWFLTLGLPGIGECQAVVPARATLIRNATVLTVTRGTIPNGAILIENGKISAVGRDIATPAGAEVIDARGMYVMPGIIDCHSHIAGGGNESSLSVTSMVGIEDVIDPTDINIYRDLAGGVTTSNILHGSANAIGGKCQPIKLRWGKDAEGLKFEGAPPSIKFALGENPKRANRAPTNAAPRYPTTRMGVEDVIRDAFNRTRENMREWDEYRAKQAKGQPAMPPRKDLALEALAQVLRGERLVHAHCYREDEILMLIRLAEEFGFRIATFQHVLEGYKVAKEIAAHGAGASTFSDWWAFKIEAYDAIPYNAAVMTRKGVVVSINSDSAEEARHLNQEAAKCMKYGGLTEEEALKLITINPAQQMGIARRVGSIEAGKDADLVLYNLHPFSTRALPQKVWIDGTLYFDREKDFARRKEIVELKRKLKAEEESTGRTPRRGPAGSGGEVAQNAARRGDAAARAVTPAERVPALAAPSERVRAGVQTLGPNALAQAPAPPQRPATPTAINGLAGGSPVYAIRDARIYPVSGPVIEKGTVLVAGGKIAAVGASVPIPRGATVINGAGLSVYPGMIDAQTTMGLTEIGAVDATVDVSETGEFNQQLRAYDAIHPASEHIPVTRVNGVTTTLSRPGGGIFSGQATLINLDGWTVEELVVQKSIGLVANLPRPGGSAEARREYDRRVQRIADLLDEARHYVQAKAARERDTALPVVRRDEKLEALIPLLKGEIPLLVPAGDRSAIKAAVEFAGSQKLKIVILGGAEAGKMAAFLKEKDVPVIFGPVLDLPAEEDDPYDLPYATPGILARAGVRFAIASGSTSDSRNLPFDAGTARGLPDEPGSSASAGLTEDEALRAVTLSPAQILGVADRLGSIEAGKIANLVVTDGDLLEIRTQVKHLFINGRPIPLESKHTRLYERYLNRP